MPNPLPPPGRRWFQFRLRTLLIAVAVVALPCAWVANSLRWIEARRAALARHANTRILRHDDIIVAFASDPPVRAPGGLWLLGENGYEVVFYYVPHDPPDMAQRLTDLFPESRVAEWIVK